jgi:hypothetical protein
MPLPRRARLAILPLVLLLALPNGGSAQAGAAEELDFMLSVNPLALVALGVFSGEFEQVLTRGTSGGASVFYARADNRKIRPPLLRECRLPLLPFRALLRRIRGGDHGGFTVMDDEGASRNAIGLGFNLEHQWLLGEDRRLGVAAGLGGQRLFFLSDRGQATRAVPMGRLSLGWAF